MATANPVLRQEPDLTTPFSRLLDLDFSRPMAFGGLTIIYFLLRLPFINYGHGTDPDAWRVALTAHHLLDTGKYLPSRLPGNPLHEILTTIFIPGGWIATNLATAAVSLLGVYVFIRLINHLQLPNRGVLTIAFAFTPLLFINSIATMDYMWALTASLGAVTGCVASGNGGSAISAPGVSQANICNGTTACP
jgi:hypothetical protein